MAVPFKVTVMRKNVRLAVVIILALVMIAQLDSWSLGIQRELIQLSTPVINVTARRLSVNP